MKTAFFTIALIVTPFVIKGQGYHGLFKKADSLYHIAGYSEALEVIKVLINSENVDNRLLISSYILTGNIYLEGGQYSAANQFYEKAFAASKTKFGENDTLTIQAVNNLGQIDFLTGQNDQSFNRNSWVLEKRKQIYGEIHPEVADSYNNLANCKYAFKEFDESLILHKSAFSIRESTLPEFHNDIAISCVNIGNCFLVLNQIDSAIVYLEKALKIRKQNYDSFHPKLASVYISLGKGYARKSLGKKALNCFEKAKRIYQKKFPPNHPKLLGYYETIGDVLINRGIYNEALIYYMECFNGIPELNKVTPRRSKLADKIGLCLQHLGEYKHAITFHKNAVKYFLEDFGKENEGIAAMVTHLGNAYFRSDAIEEAFQQYQLANKYYKRIFDGIEPTISNNLGLCALELGKTSDAIQFFEDAINFPSPNSATDIERVKFFKNLAYAFRLNGEYSKALEILYNIPSNVFDEKTARSVQLSVLSEKAVTYSKLGNFDLANRFFATADSLAQNLRVRIIDPEGRKRFQKSSMRLYSYLVEYYFDRWNETSNGKMLEAAFEASEKSKSLVLLESVYSSNVRKFAGVPDEILEREKQLLSLMTELGDDSSLSELTLTSPQIEFESFLDEIENNYPEYFKLKYQISPTSIEEMKALLKEGQTILEYFIGVDQVFVFIITNETSDLIALPKKQNLNEMLLEFRRAIDAYPKSSGEKLYKSIEKFNFYGHKIYEYVFAPLTKIRTLGNELIIIPDGILHYLPFECLLTLNEHDSDRFKTHSYLIFNHQISYVYSASMLEALSKRKLPTSKKSILSVAPSFDQNGYGLAKLRHNISEASEVSQLFNGDALLNEEANLSQFLKMAPDYRMLLFATHGAANPNAGENSWLAFTEIKDTLDNELLYARTLYENPLSASLVVLSACETGIGEYQEGEGVLSLARGFFYAGAQSIIPTLWSVDDARNSEIIKSFFEYLKGRNSVSRSLHLAKLEFLKYHSHDEAHPVFWAAPVVIGLTDVNIKPTGGRYRMFFFVGFAALIMIGFIYLKKIQNERVRNFK